jgi:predicted alpha/beta hydrolase family esterase
MKTADCDILIVPGLGGSEEDHWQARWAGRLATARVVEQDQWHAPTPEAWCGRIAEAVAAATRPVILIAHSLGVVACVEAVPHFPAGVVRGALLVSVPDVEENPDVPAAARVFAPVPRGPQPFPSLVVASPPDTDFRNQPAPPKPHAGGALTVDAGESGHINVASGHGPWPEGLMRLAGFLKGLSV